jgi:hypothetical protein
MADNLNGDGYFESEYDAFDLLIEEIESRKDSIKTHLKKSVDEDDVSKARHHVNALESVNSLVLRIKELKKDWQDLQKSGVDASEYLDDALADSPAKTRKTKMGFLVRFPDGEGSATVISEKTAADTSVAAIGRIGVERVKSLNIHLMNAPLIDVRRHPNAAYTQQLLQKYWITTHCSTDYKIGILTDVAKKLKINMEIEKTISKR